MTNPRVYARLQREINCAVRDGRAHRTGEGLVSAGQARSLPYLQAVARESLRFRYPVSNIFPRDVPAEGDLVTLGKGDERDSYKEVFLPGGVCIGYSAYAMHHSEKTYWEEAKLSTGAVRWVARCG